MAVSLVGNIIGAVAEGMDHRILRCISDYGPPGFMFCGVNFHSTNIEGVPCQWMYPSGMGFKPPSAAEASDISSGNVKSNLMSGIQSREEAPKVLLYIHGGAFVFCTPSTQRLMLAEVVQRTGMIVLAINYPRPPESPAPRPIAACLNVYDWLRDRMPLEQLVVGGDSAGGCLSLDLARSLIAKKKPVPSQLVLFSPWVDLDNFGEDWDGPEYNVDIIRNKPFAKKCAAWYRGDMALEEVSPTHFPSLEGFPPTLMLWGGSEILNNQIVQFTAKLKAAGVAVTEMRFGTMHHVVPLFANTGQPEPIEAIAAVKAFVHGENFNYRVEPAMAEEMEQGLKPVVTEDLHVNSAENRA